MFEVRKIVLWALTGTLLIAYLIFSISQNLKTERNTVAIFVDDPEVKPSKLSVAVVGDIHLPEGSAALEKLQTLLREIKFTQPDLVVFVGDYTASPRAVVSMKVHRENIINALKIIDPIPMAVVLGNYESYSNPAHWLAAFGRLNVDVMENETRLIQTVKGPVCIRGLGDYFTNRYEYINFPEACSNIPKLTLTHDPAGAFDDRMTGIVIAGHTHCGQVSLPFIGPLWVPTDAPKSAHCGLHSDDTKTVFVTSGVGTTVLPLRVGTQSQWDELNISWN